MALQRRGIDAVSFTGSQSGILTDDHHAGAKILAVRADRIRESLDAGRVVIVAGFQGVSAQREITTLGRGGSDTTAVALAAALRASRCEIYTDVDGVHSADPRVVPGAQRIPVLSYEEVLALAAAGAQVLHPRSVDVGWRFRVPIHVLTSFADGKGTVIGMDAIEISRMQAVACDPDIGLLQATKLPGDGAMRLLTALQEAGVRTLLVVRGADATLACVVARDDWTRASTAWTAATAALGATGWAHDEVAAVTAIGHAIHSHPGIAAEVMQALATWPVHCIATSATSMTCIVPRAAAADATRRLHAHLGLDQPSA
jgi:aspartate kinase